jgi:hypothetical protein
VCFPEKSSCNALFICWDSYGLCSGWGDVLSLVVNCDGMVGSICCGVTGTGGSCNLAVGAATNLTSLRIYFAGWFFIFYSFNFEVTGGQ